VGKQVTTVSPEALDIMTRYQWAGNVRELQNVIERAILICDGGNIKPEHLPVSMKDGSLFEHEVFDQKLSIEDYTKAFIQKYQGLYNEQQLANLLGITRKSLWEKRKKWGMAKGR